MIKGIAGQLTGQINTENFPLLQTGIYASSRWAYFEIKFFSMQQIEGNIRAKIDVFIYKLKHLSTFGR